MPLFRSNIHSPLEASPNKYRTDAISPLEASSNKYSSHECSPDWSPSFSSSGFWAWFKHDERTGTAVIDYSPIATNGALVQANASAPTVTQQAYFWNTLSGFGTETLNNLGCRTLRTTPSANSTYASVVAFIRPLGDGYFNAQQAIQLGHTGVINYIAVGWVHSTTPANRKLVFNYSAGLKTSTYVVTYGAWHCIYAYSQGSANNNGLYIRKSGDTDWTLALQNQGAAAGGGTQNNVMLFGGTNNPLSMNGGDAFYFANSVSNGMLTLEQATEIFDQLKYRYGMP